MNSTFKVFLTIPAGLPIASLMTDTLGDFLSKGALSFSDLNDQVPPRTPQAVAPMAAHPIEAIAQIIVPGKPEGAVKPKSKPCVKAAWVEGPKVRTLMSGAPKPKPWLVLVDGENIHAHYLESILLDLKAKGVVECDVRVFADYTDHINTAVATWDAFRSDQSKFLEQRGMTFTHCERVNRHKSTTDMHLALAGNSALTANQYDGLTVVSSDSDFLPLLSAWSAGGKKIQCYGAGALRKINQSSASDLYTDRVPFENVNDLIDDFLEDCARGLSAPSGWFDLAELSQALRKERPSFTPSSFGYHGLRQMLVDSPRFEVKQGDGKPPRGRIVK